MSLYINAALQKNKKSRSKIGCGPMLVILIIFAAILFGVSVGLLSVFAPNLLNRIFTQFTGVEMVQTRPVEGDPTRFDPIAAFDSIQAFAGEGAQLTEFEAYFVRSDGTLDLTATYTPSPRIDVEFMLKVDPPADAPPLGAGGGGTWYETISVDAYTLNQARRVTTTNASGTMTYTYVNEGMTRSVSSPRVETPTFIDPPTCPFEALWRAAIAQGAPSEAVAIIRYDEDGYDFSIQGVNISLEFTPDCEPA